MAPAQLSLNLEHDPNYARSVFVVSTSNAVAVAALDAWPLWLGGALALVGPPGSGKTHLATSWAKQSQATILPAEIDNADFASLQSPALLEDADERPQGEPLFHLINIAARPGCTLLITARTPPSEWRTDLPDLRSRLKALPVAQLYEPDDAVLLGVLAKFFQERNIKPSDDLLSYLVRRMVRSVPEARAIVGKLDEAAALQSRSVSRSLAREVLEGEGHKEDRQP